MSQIGMLLRWEGKVHEHVIITKYLTLGFQSFIDLFNINYYPEEYTGIMEGVVDDLYTQHTYYT